MAAGPQAPAAHRGVHTAPTRPPGQGILLLVMPRQPSSALFASGTVPLTPPTVTTCTVSTYIPPRRAQG
eukprot:9425862-Pyramimonas_sp.AAC.1